MNNQHLPLKERVVIRLSTSPESLDMSAFAIRQTTQGTTFCLAGLILDVSDVTMTYDADGAALGLAKGVTPPSRRWVKHEVYRSGLEPTKVVIPAKARELWANEYGEEAAELLPFYGTEWGVEPSNLDQVTAEDVINVLLSVNAVAAERVASRRASASVTN
jgi:hypothetical protein